MNRCIYDFGDYFNSWQSKLYDRALLQKDNKLIQTRNG